MSNAASLVGIDQAGGGIILDAPQAFVTVEGVPLACVGSAIADHGSGAHNSASVVEGSMLVSIEGIPVAMAGSLASCGHSLSGSAHVTIET